MNLRNITIKNKLIAGFGILAVLVVLVAGMSLRACRLRPTASSIT